MNDLAIPPRGASSPIVPPYSPPDLLRKWRLLGLVSAALTLMAVVIVVGDPGVDGVRRLIRATARSSLLLFAAAFVASAAWARFPNAWTSWLRQNRRQLGLGVAVSHAIHAGAIVAYAALDAERFGAASSTGSRISGGLAYAFIALMSLTSFDRTAAWLGPRAWKVLHTSGAWYVWLSFMIAFGKRVPLSPLYALPVLFLLAVVALRLWPQRAVSAG